MFAHGRNQNLGRQDQKFIVESTDHRGRIFNQVSNNIQQFIIRQHLAANSGRRFINFLFYFFLAGLNIDDYAGLFQGGDIHVRMVNFNFIRVHEIVPTNIATALDFTHLKRNDLAAIQSDDRMDGTREGYVQFSPLHPFGERNRFNHFRQNGFKQCPRGQPSLGFPCEQITSLVCLFDFEPVHGHPDLLGKFSGRHRGFPTIIESNFFRWPDHFF